MSLRFSDYAQWAREVKFDIIVTAGVPTESGPYPGALAVDKTNKNLYINTGTAASATWTLMSRLGGSITATEMAVTLGAMVYGDGSGVGAELAKGTAAQFLQMNAGATAPAWVSMSGDGTLANGVLTVTQSTGDFNVAGGDLTVTETADGAVGAELNLYQVSASPAADDEVGIVNFTGKDDGTNDATYARISGVISDPTDGAEIGTILLQVQDGTASLADAAEFGNDGTNKTLATGLVATESNVGTAGSSVTAVEYGDGRNHTTILTISGLAYTIAGAAAEAIGKLIYTFPAGVHVHEVSYVSVGLTGGGTVDADTPDVGVGSVIGTGAVATLDGTATFEDYVTGQTAANCTGTATVAGPLGATAGILTGISLNAAADVKAVHLNIADTWAGADTATAAGTVVLKWTTVA